MEPKGLHLCSSQNSLACPKIERLPYLKTFGRGFYISRDCWRIMSDCLSKLQPKKESKITLSLFLFILFISLIHFYKFTDFFTVLNQSFPPSSSLAIRFFYRIWKLSDFLINHNFELLLLPLEKLSTPKSLIVNALISSELLVSWLINSLISADNNFIFPSF